MKFNAFCFIPAKLESKRLKKKNLLKVEGKEMLAYAIDAAKDSSCFDEIIVSTESKEVKSVAIEYGAKVPYFRSMELAKDPYGVKDVLLDFLLRFPDYRNKYNYVFIILPTCPLLSPKDIVNVKNHIVKKTQKVVISITENDHSSFRSVLTDGNKITPIFPEYILMKSQELKKSYRINGAVVALDINNFLKEKEFFQKEMGYVVMPRLRSIDVDEKEDFELVKYLMRAKRSQKDI